MGYSCCLLTQSNATNLAKSCECRDTATSCDAEAASRPGSTVVAQCPPPGEGPKIACAAAGENCRPAYLRQNNYAGCCDGTICLANASGVPVCTQASADQIALAQKCDKVAQKATIADTELVTKTLGTSAGELQLDKVQFAFYGVGPGGCLNSLDVTLAGGGTASCFLELKATLVNGKLMVTEMMGDLGGCAGSSPTSLLSTTIIAGAPPMPLEVTFNGVSCSAPLSVEEYCVSGTYDFHLTGGVPGTALAGTSVITFDDQHVVFDGVLCGQAPMGMCPTP